MAKLPSNNDIISLNFFLSGFFRIKLKEISYKYCWVRSRFNTHKLWYSNYKNLFFGDVWHSIFKWIFMKNNKVVITIWYSLLELKKQSLNSHKTFNSLSWIMKFVYYWNFVKNATETVDPRKITPIFICIFQSVYKSLWRQMLHI